MAGQVGNETEYLNPLTIEAQLFLNSMESLTKSCNQIDVNLCSTLEAIVDAIERFLGQPNLMPILSTEKTKLVETDDLVANIRRAYRCELCKLYLGKNAGAAAAHLADKHRKKTLVGEAKVALNKQRGEDRKERRQLEQTRKANAAAKLSKKAKSLINNDYCAFFNEHIQIAEKLKKLTLYESMEKDLLDVVTPLFPEQSIKLWKFGSRMTGIGTRNSDLDIFVDIGNNFNTFENRSSQQTLKNLYRVRDGFNRNKKTWTRLVVIDNARVPILKVCHNSTTIECDIGFSNSLGYCNTKLMEFIFELQPIARRMCIFLKKWHERCKLSESISTYSLCLMVVYFLQSIKSLPSIEQLQLDMPEVVRVGPWISNFVEKPLSDLNILKVDTTADVCKFMLKTFFEHFAEFNFAVYVVAPYFGKLTEIKDIEAALPERYAEYVKTGNAAKDDGLQLHKAIVVQDPIQLNHNVTKGVSPMLLKQIQGYFRQSADAFEHV